MRLGLCLSYYENFVTGILKTRLGSSIYTMIHECENAYLERVFF